MEGLKLNEFVVQLLDGSNSVITVNSPLYNIESNNALEVRNQSVSTPDGNEHTILKTANESLIGTKIPEGELLILAAPQTNDIQQTNILARAVLLP